MSKQSISKKFAVNACGVLDINDDGIYIEVEDGPTVDIKNLLDGFDGKVIKISASYDEEYEEKSDMLTKDDILDI